MPIVHRSVIVPHTIDQMFALVNDIARYKEFVPYCVESSIHVQNDREIQASLTLAAKGFKKSFTTHNQLIPYTEIILTLVDGPFKQFDGRWQFQSIDDASSKISLDLSFEFSSRMMAVLFGPVFQGVSTKLVDAFVSRAKEVYA